MTLIQNFKMPSALCYDHTPFSENRYTTQEREVHCIRKGAVSSQETRTLQVMLFLQITGCGIWSKSPHPERQNPALKQQLTKHFCNQVVII